MQHFSSKTLQLMCVEIARLSKDALVQVGAIAYNGSKSAK
jgi:hypothetical protein